MSHQFNDMSAANNARVEFARSKLVQRLSALERRVTNTVDRAAESVNDVTDTVKSTVSSAADGLHKMRQFATSDLVHAVDIRSTFRQAPWTSVGVAVAIGVIGAAIIAKKGWIRKGMDALSNVGDRIAETGPGLTDVLKRELMALGQSVIVDMSGVVKEQLHNLTERHLSRPEYRSRQRQEEEACFAATP
jgi:ElaB/YqjD/DUF883 family membrane-anchored ribosome-binding protein